MPSRLPVAAALLVALALTGSPAAAETRTLTAKDGRTMQAEIVGFKGDTLRVRRADTGKEFPLALSSLAATDQDELRDFMRKNPGLRDTIAPTDIRVEFSRARFQTDRTSGDSSDVRVEDWGYSFTINNLTNVPIEGLRIDYRLYAERDPDNASSAPAAQARLERKPGSLPVDPIPTHDKAVLRSEAIACRTEKLGSDSRWVTADGLKSKLRDKALYGVWLRVYDGDKLIHEVSSPVSLRTTERWSTESAAAD